MIITPPDMVLEAGNSSTLARRNVPPSKSRTARLSRSSLNLCVNSFGQGASSACETGNRPRLDVGLALGKGVEHVLRHTEVGGQDVLRVTSIQSVIENVPCSEKAPLSKDRMKWQGLSPMVWIE